LLVKLSVSDFQNPNRIVFSDWFLFILFLFVLRLLAGITLVV
jgi:hypothetical protein